VVRGEILPGFCRYFRCFDIKLDEDMPVYICR
jgi:hypothetical protein